MKPIIKSSKLSALQNILPGSKFEIVENKFAKKALAEYCKHKERRAEKSGDQDKRPKQSYRRGEIWITPVLTKKQKADFKELLCRAYGLKDGNAGSFYERISLYVKKIYAAEPERFFIASTGKAAESVNALMIRHINPDGSKGGMLEVTTHFHGREGNFIVSQKSIITGETVLEGDIALYSGSKVNGGRYENVTVIGSVLNGCHIKNCRLESTYAHQSSINVNESGQGTGMLKIKSCVIKRSEVNGSMHKAVLVDKR